MLAKLSLLVLVWAVLLGLVLLVAKSYQVKPTSTLQELGLTCSEKPQLCQENVGDGPLVAPPNRLIKSGRWNLSPELPNIGDESSFQFKRWNYVSVVNENFFIAALLVKFPYISEVFTYVLDRRTGEKFMYEGRLPLGLGLSQYMYTSTANCSSWGVPKQTFSSDLETLKPWIQLCAKLGGGYRFRANVPGTSNLNKLRVPLQIDVTMHSGTELVFAYPLAGEETRLAYVVKLAGMRVVPSASFVQIGEDHSRRHTLDNAAGALDWTKGRMLYRTAWRWVSFNDVNASVDGRPVLFGINLSNEVYDIVTETGETASIENAIWLDGKLVALTGQIDIIVPERDAAAKNIWRIQSKTPTTEEHIDLTFTPSGARDDLANFGVLVSNFIQPYGSFSGKMRVRGVDIQLSSAAFGVVEDHLAYW